MDFPYCFPPRADDLEASDILRPLKLKKVGLPRSGLRPLMHACLPETVKKEGRTDFSRLEKCFRLIVLNLIENGRIGLYTAIPLQKSKYSKGESLNRMYLRYAQVSKVLSALTHHGMVEHFEGFNDPRTKVGRVGRYYPTAKIGKVVELEKLANAIEAYWDDSALIESKVQGPPLPEDHPDLVRLRKINDFLKNFDWPKKAPLCLKWAKDGPPLSGGRIYTLFQNMPKMTRQRYLTINGQPTIELDFQANHARMAMAIFDIPVDDDPYATIASKTGFSRQRIKDFFQVAFGASSKVQCKKSLTQPKKTGASQSFSVEEFNRIDLALEQDFKRLPIYKGIGTSLQSLEGQITLDVLCAGVDADIPVLPLHDSFITFPKHEAWLHEQMVIEWKKHVLQDNETNASPRITKK